MMEGWIKAFGPRRADVIRGLIDGYGVEDMERIIDQEPEEIRDHINDLRDLGILPAVVEARNRVMRSGLK